MPDYKKKKHKRKTLHKSKKDFANDSFEITVKSKREVDIPKTPRVIKGNKELKGMRFKVFLSFLVIMALILSVSLLIFPVGIAETFNNFVLSVGSGEYPVEISGSRVLNVSTLDNYYYVLSDLNVYAVSNSGKQINSFIHGFANPVLKTSKTRALIYDQGQKTYCVYTLKKAIISETLKFDIICADVSDSGKYAIATQSDSYSSTVSVYDKKGTVVFTWNCAKDLINSVTLSPNGKHLAVSTVNALNGELSSKVYILDINKTDAKNTFDYADKTVYSLNSNRKGIYVVSAGGYSFIRWSNGSKNDEETKLDIEFFRESSKGALVVENRTTDRSDNTVILLKNDGQKYGSFDFDGNISDIRQSGSHIYIISDGFVYIYNTKGELISRLKCDHDIRYLVPNGSRSVALVSDNAINSIVTR